MSSFGSSLINKGRKIVPKAAGRRRPAAAAALSTQDTASVTSGRSSVEASQTPQPDLLSTPATSQPRGPTPEDPSLKPIVRDSGDGLSTESSASAALHSSSSTVNLPVPARNDGIPQISSSATWQRSTSPEEDGSGPSKRRRVGPPTVERTATPPAVSMPPQRRDDGIPVVQVSKRPPQKASRTGRSATDEVTEGEDGLVQYEAPDASGINNDQATSSRNDASQPTIAPLLMASVAGPKPRAKGTRRNQWQVTTQADLAPPGSRQETEALEEAEPADDAENDPITVVGPKIRKVRKDKGIKKGPMKRARPSVEVEEDFSTVATRTRSARTQNSEGDEEALTTVARRGRTIAPHPAPAAAVAADGSPPLTEPDSVYEPSPEAEVPQPTSTSARLRNAQKRRAKQIATGAAKSRASASQTAAAIDVAIAQSIEGGSSQFTPIAASPLFRVQAQEARSRSRRSSSLATDATETTSVAEGSLRQRKRYRRQATPPGNETVFIAEKVTPMISLVGRDTENRVGMRSTMEMKMRGIDWKDVKQRHSEQLRQAAVLKGKRRTNDFDVIFGHQDTPIDAGSTPAGGVEGGEDDDDDDGSILEKKIKERERKYGKSAGMQLTIVNGEHRMDETNNQGQRDFDNVEDQVAEGEEIDIDELTKRRFNVHTFITWKRREPEERVYQSSRWNDEETEKFYEALRCCGVDFGSMAEWFPGRIRRSIKRKFNVEERINPERINETLNAHMMLVTGEEMGDNGTGWDMSRFHANGAGRHLKDPREVEQQLAKERAEKEVEIAQAKKDFDAEKANQKLAGVQSENEEEEEEGEEGEEDEESEETEEGSEEEETIGDVIRNVQLKKMEDKRKERAAAAKADTEQDGEESDEEDEEDRDEEEEEVDGEVMPTAEDDDDEEVYYEAEEEAPPDWDDD